MKEIDKDIIHTILNKEIVTSTTLSEYLEVSVRTIKSHIKQINEQQDNIISSSKDGYYIPSENKTKAMLFLSNQKIQIPQTSKERVNYIITHLIHHNENKQILDIFDLCEELCISYSTLKLELNKVKKIIKKYDLEIKIENNKIKCTGLEKNKRKLLSSTLYKESNVNFVNIDFLQSSFKNIDINFIKTSILKMFEQYHYFINYYSLMNLVVHVTIAVDRIRNNNVNKENISFYSNVPLHEYNMALDLVRLLENKFNIKYCESEIYELSLLIVSRATTIDYNNINETNIINFVGPDCLDLVNNLINEIKTYYLIDLSEKEFYVRFALHIKNLIIRSQNDYFNKNPLTESIKLSCPLIYDISVSLAKKICEKTGVNINDDEIAYIAFHLGSALEAQKELTSKVKAILYYPDYYGMNTTISEKITQNFEDSLILTNILTSESLLEKSKDVDLIITLMPLSYPCDIPYVKISFILNQSDIYNLQTKIKEIQLEKKKKEFRDNLNLVMSESLFSTTKKSIGQKACIKSMVNKFQALGYVHEDYEKEILEREKLSSTAFGNFAISHTLKMNAKKTGMAVMICQRPAYVEWDNKHISLVLMMCFNQDERYIFNKIYEPITMILSEPENVKRLCLANNYKEFTEILISFIDNTI